jgi:hypothetical protein
MRSGYLLSLSAAWADSDGGSVSGRRVPKERVKSNWRVRSEAGEVLAIEPDREHEHVFEGSDPFMDALEYAAKQLREGA